MHFKSSFGRRECDWKREKNANPEINRFLSTYVIPPNMYHTMNDSKLLNKIQYPLAYGAIYGAGTFDLEVPEDRRTEFSEFPPFIYTREVSFEDIGETMQDYIRRNGLSEKPVSSLCAQTTARELFVTSDLLKFYLDLGVVVTKVHEFVEYIPTEAFGKFADIVVANRKESDINPDHKSIGEGYKLAGVQLLFCFFS